MTQSGPTSSAYDWRLRRRYARVPLATLVELYTRNTVGPALIGRIDNLSLGGVLISCRESFDLQTELAMLFQLPTGSPIHAFGRVIYTVPERRFGVSFIDLDPGARQKLEEFTRKELGYSRRSSRVPYRTHLTIRSLEADGSHTEESADSVLVNKNGGLLVCRRTYKEGQEIYLWSTEQKSGVHARVVFQHVWATSGLAEVGVEFLADEDFWKINFVNEFD